MRHRRHSPLRRFLQGMVAAAITAAPMAAPEVFAQQQPAVATAGSFEEAMAEGQQKMAAGETQGALEAYRRAFAISSAGWLVAANRGNAADQLGLHVEAAQMYRHALGQLSPADEAYAEYQPKLTGRLQAAEAKVGQLVLMVSRPGAEVLLEGQVVGRAPLPQSIYAMPGSRELQVRLPGYDAFRWNGNVVAGQTITIDVKLTRSDSPPPKPLPTSDDQNAGMSDAQLGFGIAGVGLGAGGVIAAVVLSLAAGNRADDVTRLQGEVDAAAGGMGNGCGTGSPFTAQCAELADLADEEATLRGAAIGVGVAGGVLLVAGIVTLALPLSNNDGGPDIGLSLGSDGLMMNVSGGF